MLVLKILFIGYIAIGFLYWLFTLVGVFRIVRGMRVIKDLDLVTPVEWPKVSVVIPACNEAESLEGALKTVLAQDYPDLEIVLIDDRSTDATGAIIDRLAADDDRVKAVHIRELPDGWLGKVHALDYGFKNTTGRWLLFTDADVYMAPDTLRRVVAYCEERQLDHLPLMPDLWPSALLIDTAISGFIRIFCICTRPWAVENPRSSAFVGVGAFNFVRRSALEKTPGFEWLRLEVADDVGLGLMLKRSGARCSIASGAGLIGLHWYRSLASMARGVEKAYSSVGHCNPVKLVVTIALLTLLEMCPFVAIAALGMTWIQAAGAVMLLFAVASIVMLSRWAKRALLPGLLFPLAIGLNLIFSLRAAWLGYRRGGVLWRDTLYTSSALREGVRVKLFH